MARPGRLEWPLPEAFLEDDLVSYGYARSRAAGRAGASRRATARCCARAREVLVCNSQCLPASFELERPLRRRAGSGARRGARALRGETAARLPRPAAERGVALDARFERVPRAEGEPLAGRRARDRLRCRRAAAAPRRRPRRTQARSSCTSPRPGWCARACSGPRATRCGSRSRARRCRAASPSRPCCAACWRCAGRTARRGPSRSSCRCPRAPRRRRPERAQPAPARCSGRCSSASLGGLVLNLMPCVLPVLALKLAALAEISRAAAARSSRTRPPTPPASR